MATSHFGAPGFTPWERFLLRVLAAENAAAGRLFRFRYRDRMSFGADCRIDHRTVMHSGLGRVIFEDGVIIDRGLHKVGFHLESGSEVRIGRGTWIQTFDADTVFSCKAGARIELGPGCWFSGGIFGASQSISVGAHTLIGWGCMILDSNMHRMDNDAPPPAIKPVSIGSHVWMPSHVTVLPGAAIGDHCVIGTGSLVKDDIPSNSFAAGRPARVIRKIGNRDQVE